MAWGAEVLSNSRRELTLEKASLSESLAILGAEGLLESTIRGAAPKNTLLAPTDEAFLALGTGVAASLLPLDRKS